MMGDFEDKMEGIFSRFMDRMFQLSQDPEGDKPYFQFYREEFEKQLKSPTLFKPYNARDPKHTSFAKHFIRIGLDQPRSKVLGSHHLKMIVEQVQKGENAIFFANHQVEPDPQILQVLLGEIGGPQMDEMIFVAGDRVVRDPIAIPMSLGCNLLCIYSKKYIETPKEMKEEKLLHNKKVLKIMENLLTEGSKIIYVAPSGGRDRADSEGKVFPAPFDPSSIELFYLIAQLAKTPCHFYPLALYTYPVLPPPSGIQVELGEERIPSFCPVFVSIGAELNMELDIKDLSKEERRSTRCAMIYNQVRKEYLNILKV